MCIAHEVLPNPLSSAVDYTLPFRSGVNIADVCTCLWFMYGGWMSESTAPCYVCSSNRCFYQLMVGDFRPHTLVYNTVT